MLNAITITTLATLTGYDAIEAAERGEVILAKHADPIKAARATITINEARSVVAEDPSLVYAAAMVAPPEDARFSGTAWLTISHMGGSLYRATTSDRDPRPGSGDGLGSGVSVVVDVAHDKGRASDMVRRFL